MEIIEALAGLAQETPGIYSKILIAAMPKDNGICMYEGAGAPVNHFIAKDSYNRSYVTLNAKHRDQEMALKAIKGIHTYLTMLGDYPQDMDAAGGFWQIADVTTSTAVNFIGQEENGQYLYGSILQVNFYYHRR